MANKRIVHVAYIVGEYPSRTESFIANEIDRIGRYVPLTLFALKGKSGTKRIVYSPSLYSIRLAACHVREFLHKPLRYVGLLVDIAMGNKGCHSLNAFYKGMYFVKTVRRSGIGHLHAHFASFPADVAIVVSRMTGVPFSISAHAHDIYTADGRLGDKIKRAAFLVTCTRYNQTYLQNMYPEYAAKIHMVYHGIVLSDWPYVPPPFNSAGPNRILFVGRLVEKKGLIYLLQSVRMLVDREFDLYVDVVGNGPLRDRLSDLCKQYDLHERVRFHGWLSQQQIRALHRQCTIIVQPSIRAADGDQDGIPNVLIEAMASGVPVVTTAISGIPELVNDQNGILVPPRNPKILADAIIRLCHDETFRERIVLNGREMACQFDMDRHIDSLYGLFRQYCAMS